MFVLVKQISTGEICFIVNIKKQMHSHNVIEPMQSRETLVTFTNFIQFYTFENLYIRDFTETSTTLISEEIPFYEKDLLVKHQLSTFQKSSISNTRNVATANIQECTMNFCSFMHVLKYFCNDFQKICTENNLSQNICCILWNQIYSPSFDQNITTLTEAISCVLHDKKSLLKKCRKFIDRIKNKMIADYRYSQESSLISQYCYLNDIIAHMKCKCVLYIGEILNSESLISMPGDTGEVCIVKDVSRLDIDKITITYEKVIVAQNKTSDFST